MIVLDAPHDASDRPLARRHRSLRKTQRNPVDGNRRHIDGDADRREQAIGALADAARAELVARVSLFLQHDDAPREVRRRVDQENRRREPRRPSAHDDDVRVVRHGAIVNLGRG